MGKIKGFFKSNFDIRAVFVMLLCLPSGIYKLFFQENRTGVTIIEGFVLLIIGIGVGYFFIKNKGKEIE